MPRDSTTLAPWAAQQNSHHDRLQQEVNELKEQLEHVKSVVVATQEAISKRHSLKLKTLKTRENGKGRRTTLAKLKIERSWSKIKGLLISFLRSVETTKKSLNLSMILLDK